MINVIGYRSYFLGIAGVLILVGILCFFVFGLKMGIDLVGGTELDVELRRSEGGALISESEVGLALSRNDAFVRRTGDATFEIRLPSISEEEHQTILTLLSKSFSVVDEKSFSSIGPIIGAELRSQSLWAVILVMLFISLYVAYAFRHASSRVSSWKYGVVTLVTLFHDVIIPTGVLAVLGRFQGIEIDTNFIVALLVVMGFSVHDTIVVFDRIRENVLTAKLRNASLAEVFNVSVTETMARSLNTSLTLVFVLVALLFFGPASLFYFILTILIGTVVGTYSSIFVASPLLYIWARERV